jgi:predicted HAD superfamily Cof-like phosphohydrolase
LTGDVKVCDEKVKLYRNTNVSSLENINKLGEAVSELAMSNTRIWHLEDEVRREDLLDSEVVKLKRNIDQNNQERCNLVDKVDEILQQATNQKN